MSRRGRGRRYDSEPKLNVKKVIAVIIAILVFLMFIFIIAGFFTRGNERDGITSLSYFTSFQDNKWGIIDSNGSDIITPSYEEMIIVPDAKKNVAVVFISKLENGKTLHEGLCLKCAKEIGPPQVHGDAAHPKASPPSGPGPKTTRTSPAGGSRRAHLDKEVSP